MGACLCLPPGVDYGALAVAYHLQKKRKSFTSIHQGLQVNGQRMFARYPQHKRVLHGRRRAREKCVLDMQAVGCVAEFVLV